MKRKENIDLLKAIAITMILIYHGICYNINYQSKNIYEGIFTASIPLFFLINGYLLFSKDFNLKKHTYKIIRLTLLTIIWGIITTLLILIIKNQQITFEIIFNTLWKLKYGYVNHLWFMGSLICIYIFFPLFKSTFDNNKKAFIWTLVLCFIFVFCNKFINMLVTLYGYYFKNIKSISNINYFSVFNPYNGLKGYTIFYFLLGGLIKIYEEHIRKTKIIIPITGIIISIIGLYSYRLVYSDITSKIYDIVWNGFDTLMALIITVSLYRLCINYNFKSKIITFISKNTFGIYLIHMLYIHLTIDYIKEIPFFCSAIGNIVYGIYILILSSITIIIIKKIPIIKKILQ